MFMPGTFFDVDEANQAEGAQSGVADLAGIEADPAGGGDDPVVGGAEIAGGGVDLT